MQVAMRAPGRGFKNEISVGTPEGGEGFKIPINAEGVALVHSAHVAAVKALGFRPCSEENPNVPAIASLSEDDWAAVQEFKRLQAKAERDAKATESAEAADKAKAENVAKVAQAAANAKR